MFVYLTRTFGKNSVISSMKMGIVTCIALEWWMVYDNQGNHSSTDANGTHKILKGSHLALFHSVDNIFVFIYKCKATSCPYLAIVCKHFVAIPVELATFDPGSIIGT